MEKKLQAEVLKITHLAASEMSSEKDIYRLLKCFKAWIWYDTPEEIKKQLADHKMVMVALNYMHDDYLTEYAVEVLQDIIEMCKNPNEYQKLYNLLIEEISKGLIK